MFKQKFYLVVFVVFQLFSTLLISIGAWPAKVVLLNLLVQLAAVVFFDEEYALFSVVLSIPFYLILPNAGSDTLSAWRYVFLFLFLAHVFRNRPRYGIFKKIVFFKWDKVFAFFLVAAFVSLIVAADRVAGVKKLAFILNIYFLYVVTLNVIRSKEQLLRMIVASFISLATIVLLGFVQFFSTFATTTYYFWQYWAVTISKAYYGTAFSDTAIKSNSWFSFSAGQPPSLRMFSVLPDSHAFAVIAMFSIPFATALTYFAKHKYQRVLLWVYVAMAALAVALSGTRGVWAAVIAPIALIVYFQIRKYGSKLFKPMWIPLALFIFFLAASPALQKLVAYQNGRHTYGSFIDRAETITQLNEPSNAGRIRIWKQTLKFWVAHPVLGSGFANFQISLSSADAKAYNLPLRYITAHSLYLDVLAETGIIGFIFFLNYVFGIFRHFYEFLKKHQASHGDGYVFFVLNCGLYLAWLFAYSLVDGTLLNDRVLMFFLLILAICARIMLISEHESSPIKDSLPSSKHSLLSSKDSLRSS